MDAEFGLIVQQEGRLQHTLSRSVMLVLNYRYGLDLIVVHNIFEAFSAIQKHKARIRCVFIIQNKAADSKSSIASLTQEGHTPLFLVVPASLIEFHRTLCHRVDNLTFCAWEEAFGRGEASLCRTIGRVFAAHGVGELFGALEALSYGEMKQRIERRFKNLKTLPTLPEIILKIMAMIDNPDTSVEELETVLTSDPAIVYKVLQVVNSPTFAGSAHKGGWSLNEAIVRLGRRKVGAIAQQVKLMTSLVKPEESLFDLGRFWKHSVGCALIADKLYTEKRLLLAEQIEFNDYWIGALLHDAGKLVLGFFFWDHFEKILQRADKLQCSFREAERELSEAANHEYLGQLLLMKSGISEELAAAVGAHHTTGKAPGPMLCLLHMANNICKDLGMGCLPREHTVYSASVLRTLGMEKSDVRRLIRSLEQEMVEQIEELVAHCLN